MTLGIGIKCKDGVVIASDSQVEFGRGVSIKRLNANKIYKINDRLAVVGSGKMASIDKAIDTISKSIKERERREGRELGLDELVDIIEKTMTALHKEYNIDRSEFLGRTEEDFFDATLVAGGMSEVGEPILFLAHPDGLVEGKSDYGTIGMGAAFAELLLKNFPIPDIEAEEAVRVALYIIKEVEEVNPDVGGPINIGFFTPEGYKELEPKERSKLINEITPAFEILSTHVIPRILKGKISVDELGKL